MTMADSRQRLATHFEAGEPDLERLLRARDRGEIAQLMRRLLRWRRELITLAKAHDPVALHFFNVRPEPQETVRISKWYPDLRDRQRHVCNYVEAALGRLNTYLRQPDARPKDKGGNRRTFDTEAIAAKARDIWKSNGGENKIAAAREAMARHPDLATGRGDPENIAKRIARQI